jgi:hypothetical protein
MVQCHSSFGGRRKPCLYTSERIRGAIATKGSFGQSKGRRKNGRDPVNLERFADLSAPPVKGQGRNSIPSVVIVAGSVLLSLFSPAERVTKQFLSHSRENSKRLIVSLQTFSGVQSKGHRLSRHKHVIIQHALSQYLYHPYCALYTSWFGFEMFLFSSTNVSLFFPLYCMLLLF